MNTISVKGFGANMPRDTGKAQILSRLDDDVAKIFPDAKSVNSALRALGKIIDQHQQKA